MNSHREWLQQLQEKCNKRTTEGDLTDREKNEIQFSKNLQEDTVNTEEKQQLDELPMLAPLALGAVKAGAGAVARAGIRKLAAKGARVVGKAAVQSVMTPGQPQESIEQSEEDMLLEEIANDMIQIFEGQIGRSLSLDEIEEFVENNYEKIVEEAKNQVTAKAIPGDKNKGVGAEVPEEPSAKSTSFAAAVAKVAKGTGPKRVGNDGY